jgi:DNA modification methylase
MTILCGDCLDVMKTFPDNHFSAVVTDPPYGLHFMGKDWDCFAKGKVKVGRKVLGSHTNSEAHEAARYDETRNDEFQEFMTLVAREALRITKPGGHILMFGAPRRYHRQACAIEDAGWEIRDCLMWVFGSGFPKSRRVSMFLDQHRLPDDFCQCAANKPYSACTTPLHNVFDRIYNLVSWEQVANEAQNALYGLQKALNFQGDCQGDRRLYGELLHWAANAVQASLQSPKCVPAHTHCDEREDGFDFESFYNLLQARHNYRLSKQDCALRAFYSHALQLLQEYIVAGASAGGLRKKTSKPLDFSTFFDNLVASKTVLNSTDILCLVFCLPSSLISLLSERKVETILPFLEICGECNKLVDIYKGFGSALKPAFEPVLVGMKPLDGTFLQNAEKWNVAGLNIDACRVATNESYVRDRRNEESSNNITNCFSSGIRSALSTSHSKGRWPANLVLDEEAGELLDEQSGISKSSDYVNHDQQQSGDVYMWSGCKSKYTRSGGHNDSGGASRFFYCPKSSSRERGEGNNHPTVKPLALMRYLLTLISPPSGALILDPFAGSGTTILAAKQLGIEAIGIEKSEEYAAIAKARVGSDKANTLDLL